jgi:hypothetical protein
MWQAPSDSSNAVVSLFNRNAFCLSGIADETIGAAENGRSTTVLSFGLL